MSPRVGQLFTEAKTLSQEDRGELIECLLGTLDDEVVDSDVEAAWDAEIRQRIQELSNGEVQAVPWSEARRQILDDSDDADLP